ncbi:uncharacterized protein LOC132282871 [Cornus florida]|uniref:uncharacterized protein LOC132282871 n=1 Tax=Cornus florida TaxID=4283 RepID=UPI00289BDE7C|nr:uncharacterized protein LOC132282871 [Cornus florida]
MNSTLFSPPKPLATTPIQIPPAAHHRHLRPIKFGPIKSSSSNDTASNNNGEKASQTVTPRITPPDTVEIRFRRGSRRRQRQQEQDGITNGLPKKAEAVKDWEDMTITEKAIELYVGEKGALFWLNKFAYASIFIVIGAWILFRFVGPALNLYQLDSPPLSPTSILKG